MSTIRFSHVYRKMPSNISGNNRTTKLLEVLLTTKENLSQDFIQYDTVTIHDDHYPLPSGRLIVLLLITDNQLWTTIRRFTQDKYEYYRNLRGQMVNIEINGE